MNITETPPIGSSSKDREFSSGSMKIGGTTEPVYHESRQGDVRDSQADITKARAILNYEPTVSFEDGLRKTIEWYREVGAPTPA